MQWSFTIGKIFGITFRIHICHESLTRHFAIRAALRGIAPETIIEE